MTRSYRSLLLAAVTATVLVPSTASSQTLVGVKGGVNFGTIDFNLDGVEDAFQPAFKWRPGLVAGVFVGRDINDRVGLQVEALYSQKATESNEFGLLGNPANVEFRVDYLEIPVLVNVRSGSSDRGLFRLYAGPSVAFRLDDSAKFDGVESSEDSGIKSFDAGVAIGASVTIRRFVIDGRYTHGLVNVEDDDPDTLRVKTRTVSFTIGYSFR